MMHRICTTDPITLHDIPDPEGKPFVVEGDHYNDVVIYFESEANRQAWLEIPVECPARDLGVNLDNPVDVTVAEG